MPRRSTPTPAHASPSSRPARKSHRHAAACVRARIPPLYPILAPPGLAAAAALSHARRRPACPVHRMPAGSQRRLPRPCCRAGAGLVWPHSRQSVRLRRTRRPLRGAERRRIRLGVRDEHGRAACGRRGGAVPGGAPGRAAGRGARRARARSIRRAPGRRDAAAWHARPAPARGRGGGGGVGLGRQRPLVVPARPAAHACHTWTHAAACSCMLSAAALLPGALAFLLRVSGPARARARVGSCPTMIRRRCHPAGRPFSAAHLRGGCSVKAGIASRTASWDCSCLARMT